MTRKTAAIIISSQSGIENGQRDFPALREIDSLPAIRRLLGVIETSKPDSILVVTGYRSEKVMRALSHQPVIFLEQADYRKSDRHAAIRLALRNLPPDTDCAMIFHTANPMLRAETIEALYQASAKHPDAVIIPTHDGYRGHPIVIPSVLFKQIVDFDGKYGMRSYLEELHPQQYLLEFPDAGIFRLGGQDPSPQNVIRQRHQMFRLRQRLVLTCEENFFGPGPAMLLALIGQGESVRSACKKMNLSYTKGWYMIHSIERALGTKVLYSQQGGSSGGRSELTEVGRELLDRYESMRAEIERLSDTIYQEHFMDFFADLEARQLMGEAKSGSSDRPQQ